MVGEGLLYHFNDDSNLQARFSTFQYGFRAGVSTETALHEFVRRIELSLAKKRTALGIFLDIVGAFDNITYKGIADACTARIEGVAFSRSLD